MKNYSYLIIHGANSLLTIKTMSLQGNYVDKFAIQLDYASYLDFQTT